MLFFTKNSSMWKSSTCHFVRTNQSWKKVSLRFCFWCSNTNTVKALFGNAGIFSDYCRYWCVSCEISVFQTGPKGCFYANELSGFKFCDCHLIERSWSERTFLSVICALMMTGVGSIVSIAQPKENILGLSLGSSWTHKSPICMHPRASFSALLSRRMNLVPLSLFPAPTLP